MANELCMGDTLAAHNPNEVEEVFTMLEPLLEMVPAYDVQWRRKEVVAEHKARLQGLYAEKELKKMVVDKPYEIQR